jgi:dihydroneopterin aldolase
MDKFIIRLESLRFYSRIGVFDQERAVGNEFSVDVTVEVAATGFESENLDTTISYADIYEVVREAMSGECLLLESVAKSVAETIKQRWKSVGEVKIKISKLAAPIPGIQGVCSVEYLSAK